jgi:hypothetical protein
MKKIITVLILPFFFINCKAQNLNLLDISNKPDINYMFANIRTDSIIEKELWKGGQFVKIFKMTDYKATPEDYFEGYDGVLESLIISSMPDGDYYTSSKLYKVEGLCNPKILEIKEDDYPKFSIKIEHGFFDNRKIEIFIIKGVN